MTTPAPPKTPSIAALRAFEAAARHRSFTRAADELHITQSAVSHQIKHLEEVWRLTLFRRQPRHLELTAAGEILLPVIRDFFHRLNGTLNLLHANHSRDALHMRLPPSIATKWLVPRLPRFRALHPDISLWLTTWHHQHHHPDALANGEIDMAFQVGTPKDPELNAWFLMHEYIYPVATPDLLSRLGMPESPRELIRFPLLLRVGDEVAAQWEDWFQAAGLSTEEFAPALLDGPRYTESVTLLQAALESQGIALVRSAAAWDDLQSGRLVRLFQVTCQFRHADYLICRRDRADHPPLRALRHWLVDEAARSQAAFERFECQSAGI